MKTFSRNPSPAVYTLLNYNMHVSLPENDCIYARLCDKAVQYIASISCIILSEYHIIVLRVAFSQHLLMGHVL